MGRNKPQRVKSDLSTSIRRLVKKRKHNTDTGSEKKQSLTEDESGKKETQEKAFSEFSSVLKSVQDTLQGIMDIKQKQKLKKKEEKSSEKIEKKTKKKLPKTPDVVSASSSGIDRSSVASPKPKRSKTLDTRTKKAEKDRPK